MQAAGVLSGNVQHATRSEIPSSTALFQTAFWKSNASTTHCTLRKLAHTLHLKRRYGRLKLVRRGPIVWGRHFIRQAGNQASAIVTPDDCVRVEAGSSPQKLKCRPVFKLHDWADLRTVCCDLNEGETSEGLLACRSRRQDER